MAKSIYATLSMNAGNFFNGAKSAVESVKSLKEAVTSANNSTKNFASGASANVSKWKSELAAAKVEISQSQSALSQVKAEQERANAAYSTAKSNVSAIKAEQQSLNQQIKAGTISTEQAKQKQEQLNQKMAKAQNEVEKTKTAQQQVKVKIDSAKAAISEAKARQEELNAKIQDGEAKIKKEESAQDKLNNSIRNGAKNKSNSSSNDTGGITNAGASNLLRNAGTGIASIAAAGTAVATAVTAVGKSMYDMANDTAAAGDEVDKMSQRLGLSRTSYQQWSYVMSQAGVDINSTSTGMKTLVNSIDDAKNGSASATEKFNRLGISLNDLTGKSREEIFSMTVSGLQSVADETEKAALANDFFGKSGQNILPMLNETAESTEALKQKALDLGMVMSDEAVTASVKFTDSMDTLQTSFKGFKNKISADFLPGLTMITDGLTGVLNGTQGATDNIANGVNSLVTKISSALPNIVSSLGQLGTALAGQLPNILTGLVSGISQSLPELVSAGGNIILSLTNGLTQQFPVLIPTLVGGVSDAIVSLAGFIPQFVLQGVNMNLGLLTGIVNSIPKLVQAIPNIISNLVSGLTSNLPQLIGQGVNMVVQLTVGLVKGIPQLLAAVPKMITSFVKAIFTTNWIKVGKDIWTEIKNGFKGGSDSESFKTGTDVNIGITNGINSSSYMPVNAATLTGENTYNALDNGLYGTNTIGTNAVNGLANGIYNGQATAVGAAANTGSSVVIAVQNNLGGMESAGHQAASKFTSGLNAGIPMVQQSAGNLKMTAEQSGQANIQSTYTINANTGAAQNEVNAFVSESSTQFSNLGNSMNAAMNNAKQVVSNAMRYCKMEVTNAVQAITKAFNEISLTIPKPKIPVISVESVNTRIGAETVTTPKFNVTWNAKGGIFRRPTILPSASGFQGVGEAGSEAIMPLDLFWNKLRKFVFESNSSDTSDGSVNRNNNVEINIYAQDKTINQIANELVPKIRAALNNM
ncbi:MAG: phage tail tape measure protein [Clostridiales bacterium]|nr:phage tail tape measure protein [Clostridiales bacterium]